MVLETAARTGIEMFPVAPPTETTPVPSKGTLPRTFDGEHSEILRIDSDTRLTLLPKRGGWRFEMVDPDKNFHYFDFHPYQQHLGSDATISTPKSEAFKLHPYVTNSDSDLLVTPSITLKKGWIFATSALKDWGDVDIDFIAEGETLKLSSGNQISKEELHPQLIHDLTNFEASTLVKPAIFKNKSGIRLIETA